MTDTPDDPLTFHAAVQLGKTTRAQRELLARVTGTETMQAWADRGAPGEYRLRERPTLLAMQARSVARGNLRTIVRHAPWALISEPVQWR